MVGVVEADGDRLCHTDMLFGRREAQHFASPRAHQLLVRGDRDIRCATDIACSKSLVVHGINQSPVVLNYLQGELGKTYQFHIYDNAGHAFFSVDGTKVPNRGGARQMEESP